jgi:hypothetical protein
MNSADLSSAGFRQWTRFNRSSEKQLLLIAPQQEGVYAIRRRTPFQRRRGTSDIVYVGSAVNRVGGLQTRCRQYFHPGPTQHTNKRILALCGDCDDFEIAFFIVKPAKGMESDLLNRYEVEHGELPPENRRR